MLRWEWFVLIVLHTPAVVDDAVHMIVHYHYHYCSVVVDREVFTWSSNQRHSPMLVQLQSVLVDRVYHRYATPFRRLFFRRLESIQMHGFLR